MPETTTLQAAAANPRITMPAWEHVITGERADGELLQVRLPVAPGELAPLAYEAALRAAAGGRLAPDEGFHCRLAVHESRSSGEEQCLDQVALTLETERGRLIDGGAHPIREALAVRGRSLRLALAGAGRLDLQRPASVCVHQRGDGEDGEPQGPAYWKLPRLERGPLGAECGRLVPDGLADLGAAPDYRLELAPEVVRTIEGLLDGESAELVERGAFLAGPPPRLTDAGTLVVRATAAAEAPSQAATATELLTDGASWLPVSELLRQGLELLGFVHSHPFENGLAQSLPDELAQITHFAWPQQVSCIVGPGEGGEPTLCCFIVRGGRPMRLPGHWRT